MRRYVLLIASALVSISAYSAQHAAVPPISEMKYHDARKALLKSGWQPVATIGLNTELEGQAKDFRALGYVEVYECAGVGPSPCRFFFKDVYGNKLQILTYGEELPSSGAYAIVNSFQLVDELPAETDSVSVVPDPDPMPAELPKPAAAVVSAPPVTEPKKYYTNPDDCKGVKAAPYAMVMGNGIDEFSDKFTALVKLIQNGSYYLDGYSVENGRCYADITVEGVYNGNSYSQRLRSLLSGSL